MMLSQFSKEHNDKPTVNICSMSEFSKENNRKIDLNASVYYINSGSSVIYLNEDIINTIKLYLKFEDFIDFLSSCKYLRNTYIYKTIKLKLNYLHSVKYLTNKFFYDKILNELYMKKTEKYLSLNLSQIKKLRKNNRINLKEYVNSLCNVNTLNLRLVYNKYFFLDDLLKLCNIQILILTCSCYEKNDLINNLDNLYERNIKTIIIEEYTDIYHENYLYGGCREILYCQKNEITQFIGDSWKVYNSNTKFVYNSIEQYKLYSELNLRLEKDHFLNNYLQNYDILILY